MLEPALERSKLYPNSLSLCIQNLQMQNTQEGLLFHGDLMMKSKLIAFGFFLVFVTFGYAESKSVESRHDPASKVVTIQMQDYRF
jgi:hypothetical protein